MTAIIPIPGAIALVGQPAHRLHLIDQDSVRVPHVAAGRGSWKTDKPDREARNTRIRVLRQQKVSAVEIGAIVEMHPASVRRILRY
jgi:hypothetical protein